MPVMAYQCFSFGSNCFGIADHYEEILYILHPRQVVVDNINKLLNCGDPSFGGAMYICPYCQNMNLPLSEIGECSIM